eukprot:CAMPEP_0115890972 /NCGR_PEP_ID=MMETSP0287-20121206/33625_1 /TAXON_ID=412157 /ORGANISM="Chrysochromulina rotalis, Strain UIO044" /LENGTH=305 /DNA_ID=CAMNT_0003347757 /DNA_START=1 /DNA_END=918 /DNA_ORIENTATION=+
MSRDSLAVRSTSGHSGGAPTDAHTVTQATSRETFQLVQVSELPAWFSPYPFVNTHYRVHFSYRLCFLSLFRLHNETVNVWTEQVAFLEEHAASSDADRWFVGCGLTICTVVRPLCSGLAHLLHCTSATGYIAWWSVDYLSISLAILASSLVSGRFAFYCDEPLQMLFFTSAAGLLCTTVVAVMAVASPALRATSFLLFVLFCNGVPLVYQALTRVSDESSHSPEVEVRYLALWGASLGTFLFGLIVKSSSLPERVAQSEWSDVFLTSHHLWHVILNVGFVFGTFLAWDAYLEWRSVNECPVGGGT